MTDSSRPAHTIDCQHSQKILHELKSFYETGILTDVTLVAGERSFACHRNVLAACSPYFRAMFTGSLREANMERITIKGVEPQSLQYVLNYVYCSEVTLDAETIQGLVQAAHMFQIEPLINHCADYLERHIDAHNCVGVYNLAVLITHKQLETSAWEYFNLHFVKVVEEEEFAQSPTEVIERVVKSSTLNVKNEETVYEALLKWYTFDKCNRKEVLWKCFLDLRLGFMKLTYLCNKIKCNQTIAESTECLKYIEETIHGHSDEAGSSEDFLFDGPRIERRLGMFARDILIITDKGWAVEDNRKLVCLDPSSAEHCSIPYPDEMNECGAKFVVTSNNDIYAASSQYEDRKFYQYNHIRKVWMEREPMLSGREKFGFVSCNGCVYALGGENDWEILTSIEKYDPLLGRWEYVAPMPREAMDMSAASVEKHIYVFSGSRTMSYNTETDTWNINLPPMVYPRFSSGITVHNNEIWLVGGEDDDSKKVHDVEVYNPEIGEWWHALELFSPMKEYYPASLNNKLYVCVLSPGFNDGSSESVIEGRDDFSILKRYYSSIVYVGDYGSEDDEEEVEYEAVKWFSRNTDCLAATYALRPEACFSARIFFEAEKDD
ncbi:kelch repeat and BTB domain-containing protein 8-like [Saccoglossus kowalevskii]|uniref:Kelch repeat and BTB domain-containing protein 8-like n=1 Tax=Saccoglossus kowalevskii TaxID=10224 RepID=A0ABM0GQZ2_SACKO|nr:PREDICTED: kelch repeat and BTB domain-containing protein 8-like [Saccoglossus kowalevskii]